MQIASFGAFVCVGRTIMRKFAAVLLFIPLLLLTLQPIACGGSTGPALEIPPTPTEEGMATETAVPTPTLRPTQTPVPETLTATFVETFPLDGYPASAPITIQFNQPMAPGSMKMPLLIDPSTPGEAVWNDDFTSFTFTPSWGFVGQVSTLTLHSGLQSADGKTLAQPQRWRLHHAVAPEVKAVPETAVFTQLYPTIHLQFTQPMNADSVMAALAVNPPLTFTIEWKSETNLALTFTEPFVGDEEYEVRLAETAVSQQNIPLGRNLSWPYHLADSIAKLDDTVKANGKTAVRLYFNYPIDPGLSDTFAFSPDIAGHWQWSTNKTTVLFTPTAIFEPDTTYLLKFTAPLHDRNGIVLPVPKTHSFTTPPLITAMHPLGHQVAVDTNVRIAFSNLVDHAAVEEAVTITPAINGRFSWQDNVLIITPANNAWEHNTQYTITITPTIYGADGVQLLKSERIQRFTTAPAPIAQPVATFGWGENVQQLFPDGRRAVQYSVHRNSKGVTATLYPLTLPQFIQRYGTGFAGLYGGYWDYEPQSVATDGLTAVSTWPITTTQAISETTLPADTLPGLYLLDLGNGTINDQLFVMLSDHTVAVKQGDGQLVAWVADRNGRSQPNATVTLYDRNATALNQATTNEDGIATFSQPLEGVTLVAAELNGQTTLTGLGGSWTSYYGWAGTPKEAAVHLYTDRPIYQPGQTVYYKAIIRRNNDARLDILPEETAVTALIRDARHNIVQTSTLQTNWFGTVNGSFTLAEGAMLGDYSVEIRALEEGHSQIFKVEEYRKPDFSVTITTDQTQVVVGDTVQITVDAAYYLGEPVPNADVTLHVYRRYAWRGYVSEPITGKTDENGRFTTTLTTDNFAQQLYERDSMPFAIEATVDDGSHQTVSGLTAIRLFATAEKLIIDQRNRFFSANAPFQLPVTVKTIQGEPVNGRSLTLTLTRYSYDQDKYTEPILVATAATNENGRLFHPITLPQTGAYKLTITGVDSRRRNLNSTTYFYAYQDQGNGYYSRFAGLKLYLDKDQYAPGETAQLFIQSDFDGSALLTWERDTIHRQQRIELTAPVTRVEIPVLPSDAPNIHLLVNAWQPLDTTFTEDTYYSLPESRLVIGSINLVVPAADKQLQVALTPNKPSYAPGEEATFTVRVTNPAGVPVSAEVSLALVDEAIFALSEVLNGSIYDSFYYFRDRTTRASDSLSPDRYLWEGGMGGGGGDGCGDCPEGIDGPRTDFPDTAAWFPVLHTDYNGEATVTVTMPDSLTSWRLTAVATTTDTQVGEAFINVQTKQAIVIQPILPEGLTAGDRVQLSTLVQNFSDAPQTITVEMVETAVSPHVSFPQTVVQTVTVPPGQREIVGWSVFAGVAGSTTLQFNARVGEQLVDAIALPLEIRPLSIPDVVTQIADFQGEWATTLTQPTNALPRGGVHLELSRSIAGSMTEGLDYLTGYPYGCVEQTMSRALPNAVVSRAFFQLGIGSRDPELEAKINASVQRLYGFQHSDGGWGWWFDDRTDAYQTAWVLFGLALVEDAGHEIDPAVLERGAAWLNDNLPQMDQRVRAFALYSLSLAGQANEQAALRAYERDVAQLDTFGKTALALALHAQGETAKGQELLDGVVETAVSTQNNLVHWSGANHDGEYTSKTMASDVRTTALVVSALAQMRPGTATETAAVRWLMTQRRAQGWGTTNETSFAILALTDHLLATSFAENGNTPYTVLLNDEPLFTGTLGPGQPSVSLEIAAEQLQAGANRLVVRQGEGANGRLYLTLNHRVYLAQAEIAAAGVVKIERSYVDVKTGKVLTAVAPGQLVRVQLRVTLPQNAAYMMVEDMLPGGLEPLNEKLNTSSRVGLHNQEPEYRWQQFGYNYKEVHRDRVTFFITEMDSGPHTFTYIARAQHRGIFTAMPTEVYAMYDLTVWGRSSSTPFVIE